MSSTILAVVIAFILASVVYRVAFKETTSDWYGNSFFYYVLIWKFSYILFHFSLFIDYPMSVLYYNGGWLGHILALLFLTIYFIIWMNKSRTFFFEFSRLYLLFYFIFVLIESYLNHNVLMTIFHVILLGISIFLFIWHKNKSLTMPVQLLLILVLLELVVMSIFESILSLKVLTLIWLTVITIISLKLPKGEGKNRHV